MSTLSHDFDVAMLQVEMIALKDRVNALERATKPILTFNFGDRVRYYHPYKANVVAFGMVIPRPATATTTADVVWVIQRNGKIYGIPTDSLRRV